MLAIINAAAARYEGLIPNDCWREPYMSPTELRDEIDAGVEFWGIEVDGPLVGVMGIQPVRDVVLIRHAYVHPTHQGLGLGTLLLRHLTERSPCRILVGAWAAAEWALRFYQSRGFHLVLPERAPELLRMYWNISDRQIETSVVLAKPPFSG